MGANYLQQNKLVLQEIQKKDIQKSKASAIAVGFWRKLMLTFSTRESTRKKLMKAIKFHNFNPK